MNTTLCEKSIVVAGAGGLLGARLVECIIALGGNVIASDLNIVSMRERLKSVGVDVESKRLTCMSLDVTDESSVTSFFQTLDAVDGAVNATYPRNQSYGSHFFDVSLDSFNENLSLHLGSAFLFTRECANYFKNKQRPFSLVNIASIYGVIAPKFDIYENTPMTTPVEYAAIKSAILHLNKYVVAYVNDSRFRVNCVSPGGIFDNQPQEFLEAYRDHTHGRGMLDAKDVVGAILFLLCDQSKFVTGQNIIVDDGFSL